MRSQSQSRQDATARSNRHDERNQALRVKARALLAASHWMTDWRAWSFRGWWRLDRYLKSAAQDARWPSARRTAFPRRGPGNSCRF
jgi:hypothetical protein